MLKEGINGYGYFNSLDKLLVAIRQRVGSKKGGAILFKNGGENSRRFFVRIYENGEMDIRGEDSYDNE